MGLKSCGGDQDAHQCASSVTMSRLLLQNARVRRALQWGTGAFSCFTPQCPSRDSPQVLSSWMILGQAMMQRSQKRDKKARMPSTAAGRGDAAGSPHAEGCRLGPPQGCPAPSPLSQSPHLSLTELPSTTREGSAKCPSSHKAVPKSHTEWYKTFTFPSKIQFLAALCSFVLVPILTFSLNNYSPSLVFAPMINFHYTAVTAPFSLHFSRLIKASSFSLLSQNELSFPMVAPTPFACPPFSWDPASSARPGASRSADGRASTLPPCT